MRKNSLLALFFNVQPLPLRSFQHGIVSRLTDLGGSRGLSSLELGAGASEVGGLGLGVLGAVVLDGGLDGILGKHAAVQLDRGEALW